MTELEFEQAIVHFAHLFDWRVAGFRPARTDKGWRTAVKYDGKGYPDLTLVHRCGIVIFAELKTTKGRLSEEQLGWADHLQASGIAAMGEAGIETARCPIRYRLWRPLDAGLIADELSFGRVNDWRL